MSEQPPPSLDPVAAQRWRARVLPRAPWLHEEVARRMYERLAWIKLKPRHWLHWEPAQGGPAVHEKILQNYPDAQCFVLERQTQQAQAAMKKIARRWWNPARWSARAARFEAPPPGGVDMLWANMALHLELQPMVLLQQWQRYLDTGGFLMFSCLGPDTVQELRALYRKHQWPPPSLEFTDMHDWGDMLVAAGFSEPVMDMERITLSFETPERLIEELRGLGRNLHRARFAALRGRAWRERLLSGLATTPLQLTFEVIYGHALKAAPRLDVRAQTTVSLEHLRSTLHQGRNYSSKR